MKTSMVNARQRAIPPSMQDGGEVDIPVVGTMDQVDPEYSDRRCPQSTEGISPLLDSTPASTAGMTEFGSELVGVGNIRSLVREEIQSMGIFCGPHMQISSRVGGGVIPHHGGDPITSESRGPSAAVTTQTINTIAQIPLIFTGLDSGSAPSESLSSRRSTTSIVDTVPCSRHTSVRTLGAGHVVDTKESTRIEADPNPSVRLFGAPESGFLSAFGQGKGALGIPRPWI